MRIHLDKILKRKVHFLSLVDTVDAIKIVIRIRLNVRILFRPNRDDDADEEGQDECPVDEIEGSAEVREVPLERGENATNLSHLAGIFLNFRGIGVVDGAGVRFVFGGIVERAASPVRILRRKCEELHIHGEDCQHSEESTEDETLRGRMTAAVVVELHAEATDLDALEAADSAEEEEDNDESD